MTVGEALRLRVGEPLTLEHIEPEALPDALGDTARAEAAHRLALRRIESLPEEAMLGPDGVFGRDDWRTWLRRHPPGAGRIATGEGDGQAGRDGAP